MIIRNVFLGAAFMALAGLPTLSLAGEVKLPETLAWTAYNTGTTGYNQSVAIGKALKDKYGVSLRVIPGKNDVSRLTPLRTGKVQYVANGVGSYFAQEGVFLFAGREWGPLPTRILATATSGANLAVGVAADAGIETMADLKGKRVAWVRGGDALNVAVEAMLAFGGLTWDDVEKVEFAGYGASWTGILNNQADAAFASTVSGTVKKIEASPRGIFWPPTPHGDADGWARLHKTAPYFVPHMGTLGAGLSKEKPHEGAVYPYPVLTTLDSQDEEVTYSLTRAIHELFDDYKKAEPAAAGWALKNQNFQWVVPYHDGAVRYWKEAGVWTGAMQAHNDGLVARQGVLGEAWKQMAGKNIADDDAFKKEWMKVRAAALDKVGLDPVWR